MRDETFEVFHRFALGGATDDVACAGVETELSIVDSVADATRTDRASPAGSAYAVRDECPRATTGMREVARLVRKYLEGRIAGEILRSWATRRLCSLTRAEAAPDAQRAIASSGRVSSRLLGLVVLLLEPGLACSNGGRRRALARLAAALEAAERDGVPSPGACDVLEPFLRELAIIYLATTDAPWPHDESQFPQWLDFALRPALSERAAESVQPVRWPVQLIPLSVFTLRFFREVLPGLVEVDAPDRVVSPGLDRFRYHPENDKRIVLLERHPELARAPFRFRYFVDSNGLAEVVLDSHSLGWRERIFAVRLFGLYNRVPDIVLDGILIP